MRTGNPTTPSFCLKLFGAFELMVEGQPIVLSDPQRELLALLILRPGPREELGKMLLGVHRRELPRERQNRFNALLSRLENELGVARNRVVRDGSRASSLSFDRSAAAIDVISFDELCETMLGPPATRVLAPGRLDRCLREYERGNLLAGCEAPWVVEERARRGEMYVTLLEALADRAAARGDLDRAIRYVRRGLSQHGSEQRLERALKQYEQRTDRRAGTVPNLVLEIIGRDEETEWLRQILLDPGKRLVTLVGVGGIGKTALGLHVARIVIDDFADGAELVELDRVRDHTLVLSEIAKTLGVPEGTKPVLTGLQDRLRNEQLLLVLDGFEHLIEAATQLDELLRATRYLKVLVTSRIALNLDGEEQYRLAPLQVPEEGTLPTVEVLSRLPSVQLFVMMANREVSSFNITDTNAQAVAEICRWLEGIPLSYRLAAHKLKLYSTAQRLLGRIKAGSMNRLSLLAVPRESGRSLRERQRKLWDLLDWSYELLSEPAKRLFRWLSVFVGAFSLAAVEAVASVGEGTGSEVEDLVVALLDHHLLDPVPLDEDDSGPRFKMLDTIREYASVQLDRSGETQPVEAAHLRFFRTVAEELAPRLRGEESATCMARLAVDYPNLEAALKRAASSGMVHDGLRCGIALYLYWLFAGYSARGIERLHDLLKVAGDVRPIIRIRAKLMLGVLVMSRGLYEQAAETFKQCLEEAQALREEAGEDDPQIADCISWALNGLGQTEQSRGVEGFAEAESYYVRSGSGSTDKGWTVASLNDRANLAFQQGHLELAERLLETALEKADSKDLWRLGWIHQTLGSIKGSIAFRDRNTTGFDEAQEHLDRALVLRKRLGSPAYVSWCYLPLGDVAYLKGRCQAEMGLLAEAQQAFEAAESTYKECLRLHRDLDNPINVALSLEGLARVYCHRREFRRAVPPFACAAAMRKRSGTDVPPSAQADHNACKDAARAALGDTTFDPAFDAAFAVAESGGIVEAVALGREA